MSLTLFYITFILQSYLTPNNDDNFLLPLIYAGRCCCRSCDNETKTLFLRQKQFTIHPHFYLVIVFRSHFFFFYTITAKVIIAVTPKALIAFKILSFTFTNCYQTVTYIRVIYFERNLKKKRIKNLHFFDMARHHRLL